MDKESFDGLDLYGVLDLKSTATVSEIRSAYRKKALMCHPDKDPDNPKAAEIFHQISQALEILTNYSSRAAYDRALKAKKLSNSRRSKLERKRRKIEESRRRHPTENTYGEDNFYDLEDRLIKLKHMAYNSVVPDGLKLFIDETMKKLQMIDPNRETGRNRIEINWNVPWGDVSNGGYNSELLRTLFEKYGEIVDLFVSTVMQGNGMVEYVTREASERAVREEKGLPINPLKLRLAYEN